MQVDTIAAQRRFAGIERFSILSPPETRPSHVRLGAGRRSTTMLMLSGALGLGLAIGALELLPLGANAKNVDPAPAPVAASTDSRPAPPPDPWVEVNHPIQLFGLAGSDFVKLPLTYRARRRGDSDERQDFLEFGSFGGNTPYLRLSIKRRGIAPVVPVEFFVAIARVASTTDLSVARSDGPTPLPTRFGVFDTADITVARGSRQHACIGFRLQAQATAPVGVAGLACGTQARAMDRDTLACVLDRLDLVSAGDDTDLRNFFVAAEQRRGQECTVQRLLSAGARDMWLDSAVPAPALKHLVSEAGRRR